MAKKLKFYSPEGDDIRVALPDGRIAIAAIVENAGFGAALSILIGGLRGMPQWLQTPIAAFAMTLAAAALIYLVARLKGAAPEVLVLAGIAVLFFFQSLQSLVQFMASPEAQPEVQSTGLDSVSR